MIYFKSFRLFLVVFADPLTCSTDRLHISHQWKSNCSGCMPYPCGGPAAFCIYRPPPHQHLLHSSPPHCPCRPCTRVTYNWFINNVNRCLGSSLAWRQPRRGKVFDCGGTSDYCVLFTGQWHRMKLVDVVCIPRGREETGFSQQLA